MGLGLAVLATPGAALCWLSLCAPWWWLGEVSRSLSLHGALWLLLPLACCWRRPWWAIVLVLTIGIGAWPWLLTLTQPRLPIAGPDAISIRAATCNLCRANPSRAAAVAEVLNHDADVVALIEAHTSDRALINDYARATDARWPHQLWSTPNDGNDLALLSRLPLCDTQVLNEPDLYSLVATVTAANGSRFTAVVVHTFSPKGAANAALQTRQLQRLAKLTAALPGPVVVLGDFNLAVGSLRWDDFLHAAHLARSADGEPATWPAGLGDAGIGIDHVLGRGLGVDGTAAFAVIGSDHRGVLARILLSR